MAIYSNDADEVNHRLCQKAGADWFFDKSLEFETMLQTVVNLADSRRGTSHSAHPGAMVENPSKAAISAAL